VQKESAGVRFAAGDDHVDAHVEMPAAAIATVEEETDTLE